MWAEVDFLPYQAWGLMFRGATKVTLDVKGRMVLPTRVRDILKQAGADQPLVATADRDGCVLIYPAAAWQPVQDDLMNRPNLDLETRWLQRLMVGYATDLDIDAQGRVLIPGELREFAALRRDGMLVGQNNHLELWDESMWKQGSAASMQSPARSTAPAVGLGEVKLSAGLPGTPPEQK